MAFFRRIRVEYIPKTIFAPWINVRLHWIASYCSTDQEYNPWTQLSVCRNKTATQKHEYMKTQIKRYHFRKGDLNLRIFSKSLDYTKEPLRILTLLFLLLWLFPVPSKYGMRLSYPPTDTSELFYSQEFLLKCGQRKVDSRVTCLRLQTTLKKIIYW